MKREILFRGKTYDGSWVYGDLSHDKEGKSHIRYWKKSGIYTVAEVDPETVGQYIGLLDKNGKNIFEGDKVKIDYNWILNPREPIHIQEVGIVRFDFTGAYIFVKYEFQSIGGKTIYLHDRCNQIDIVYDFNDVAQAKTIEVIGTKYEEDK